MTDNIRKPQEILRVEHLSVSIRSGNTEIPVLKDVSFVIARENAGPLPVNPVQAKA